MTSKEQLISVVNMELEFIDEDSQIIAVASGMNKYKNGELGVNSINCVSPSFTR